MFSTNLKWDEQKNYGLIDGTGLFARLVKMVHLSPKLVVRNPTTNSLLFEPTRADDEGA